MATSRLPNTCRLVVCLLLWAVIFVHALADKPTSTKFLERRVLIPALPTTEEVKAHMKDVGKDNYVFYTGDCQFAASWYASKTGKKFMGDTDDGSGWATLEGGPFAERTLRMVENLPTWNDDEEWEAIDIVSVAYAEMANGIVTVALPYGSPPPGKRHWPSELAALKINPKVEKIMAFDMKDCENQPNGEPRELWPNEQPKTECAG